MQSGGRFVLSVSPMSRLSVLLAIIWGLLNAGPAPGQTIQHGDEVVRVNTELVQSDVLVLDKRGQFVEGLKASDFQLKLNGKPRQILFFERLAAGSASEENLIATARGQLSAEKQNTTTVSLDRGRTIVFYLDDYHLSPRSINHVREMITKFIDQQMGANDEIAIITATGQLGFLEQLTGERAVLQRAVNKIGHRSFQTTDAERPPMNEVEALAIVNEDRRIIDYFVEQLLRDLGQPQRRQPSPLIRGRDQYESLVRARAKSIVDQMSALNTSTLSRFERFVRSSSQVPWQKIVFFVSDGFVMIDNESSNTQLHRITDAATRSGATIYTVDARGLISGVTEAARKLPSDYTGRLASMGTRSISASQLPLRTIAVDSGGEPILDTNDPQPELKRALQESSNFYQLAWRPDERETQDRKFQVVEVTLPGKPELTVRVKQGFFLNIAEKPNSAGNNKEERSKGKKKDAAENASPLELALRNIFPRRTLPVSISAGFMKVDGPAMLVTASVEVSKEALGLQTRTEGVELELIGVAVDENGKPFANFAQSLTLQPSQILSSAVGRVVYNEQLRLAPGLYQIRVAIMDRRDSRIGSTSQWLAVPDPKASEFSLSSLFLGDIDPTQSGKLAINGSHRFRANSRLGFMTYIYNAVPTAPDLSLQIQVLRDGQPVLTQPSVKVDTNFIADLGRIPYGEELRLQDLPKGIYILQVTVIDRIAKKSAQQQARFIVD